MITLAVVALLLVLGTAAASELLSHRRCCCQLPDADDYPRSNVQRVYDVPDDWNPPSASLGAEQ